MEDLTSAPSRAPKARWSRRKKSSAVVMVIIAVTAFSLCSLYEFYLEDEHLRLTEPSAHYELTIVVISNSSDLFTVQCPIPVDSEGHANQASLELLDLDIGAYSVSHVNTEYGEALEITGKGMAVVTMDVFMPGPWNNLTDYLDLSMTIQDGTDRHSYVHSDAEGAMIGIEFRYIRYQAYGLRYVCNGDLGVGWNSVMTDYDWSMY